MLYVNGCVGAAEVKRTTLSMPWRSSVDDGQTARRKCSCWPCVKVTRILFDFTRSCTM